MITQIGQNYETTTTIWQQLSVGLSLYVLEQLPPWGILGDAPNSKFGLPSDLA